MSKPYAMDPAWEHEKERLDALSALQDPGTRARIEALGIEEGWRCADIGAGTGTIAHWLSERVGVNGSVVATDMDTRFLDALDLPNLEVRKHDIVNEALEPNSYDLIHTRLVLVHLRNGAAAAVAHMVGALKPGGWLLAEDHDNVTSRETYPPNATLERITAAMRKVAGNLELNQQTGRALPFLLERAGLTDVEADGRTSLTKQGTEQMKTATLFLTFQRDRILETGVVSAEELDALLETLSTPGDLRIMGPLMVAAWGRKPA